MPFTLSHAVAVLPLARSRRLVPAALVIGSWVPDLPYFVPLLGGSDRTHAAAGPVTVDLVLGLLVLALWQLVLRRPLVDLAPDGLRDRLPAPRRLDGAYLIGAVVSLVLGAVTHVLWDSFTHARRWGTTQLPVLTTTLGPLPVHKWLQYGSGVLGLLGLGLWLGLWLRRTPPHASPSRVAPATRRVAWLVLVALSLVVAAVVAVGARLDGASLEGAAVAMATRTMGAAGGAVVLISLVWQVSAGWGRQIGGVRQGPAQRGRR